MDTNRWSFWLDRTSELMKEQQNKGKKQLKCFTENEQPECLIKPAENRGVRRLQRLQFSLINYTVLIERKVRA